MKFITYDTHLTNNLTQNNNLLNNTYDTIKLTHESMITEAE